MDPQPLILFGASGHAKVCIDIAERQGAYRVIGLIDSFQPAGTAVLGCPVLGAESEVPDLLIKYGVQKLFVAVGDNWQRFLVVQRLTERNPGICFATLVHPNAVVAPSALIAQGSVLMAGSVANPGSSVGSFCIVNTAATLDHDGRLGDYASLAPGVHTGGNVHIGSYSAIGLGTQIIHKVNIGAHSVVGAGSLVLRDMPDHSLIYGAPAQVVRPRAEGETYL